jgi:hypothetical protein
MAALEEHPYVASQVSKSDRKIAGQYGWLFRLAGLARTLPRGAVACGLDHSFYALIQATALAARPSPAAS